MVGEEAERRLLAVLLALEEERREGAEEDDGGRDAPLRVRQPVAERAVADLVVVLGGRDESRPFRPRAARRRSAPIEPSNGA